MSTTESPTTTRHPVRPGEPRVLIADAEGRKSRYDLQYEDAEGYRVTIEGLSRSFEPEFWNYAILISGMLRQRMPLPQVVEVVSRLKLYDETLNTWKNGMARVL